MMSQTRTGLRALLLFIAAFQLGGCGSSSSSSLKLNGMEYVVLDAGNLQHNGTSVSGSGSFVVREPLGQTTSEQSFVLNFTLEEGGSLALVSNSKSKLEDGWNLRFTRTGAALTVAMIVGASQTDVTSRFSGVNASGEINLLVDVHNNEDPAHILVWRGNASPFDVGDALLNSQVHGASPGSGTGTAWGFVLNKATLSQATLGTAKFVD